MQMERSSEPLISHLPFLSVTLKVEKTQCFSFTWPAQKGKTVMAPQQTRIAALTCAQHPFMSGRLSPACSGVYTMRMHKQGDGLCVSAAYVLL